MPHGLPGEAGFPGAGALSKTACMEFHQLWPPGHVVEIEAHINGLDLAGRAQAQRPFTAANFISSVDGRATFRGRSGGLGDDGDKAVFRALRRTVDAVLVGTGTLAAERYGRIIPNAQARERRRARGLSSEPLACTVTRTGVQRPRARAGHR
jgi:hypothetical protein